MVSFFGVPKDVLDAWWHMRLDWAIPCETVAVESDGRVSRMENFGFDFVRVDSLPAEIEFIVVLRVVGLLEDFAEEAERELRVSLSGPGLESLTSVEFEVPTGEPAPDHPEGWEVYTTVPVLVQFTATAEGVHMLDFYVNGRFQRCSIPLHVRVGRPA